MKLLLSAVDGTFSDKEKCKPQRDFLPEPVEIDLTDTEKLREFFTSRIHSTWQYDGTRNVKNTIAMLAVPFDFDGGEKTFEEIVEQFSQYVGVVYTSSSHSEAHPKIRVLLSLVEPITDKKAFNSICAWLKEHYPTADKQVFKISQPLFPCCRYDSGEKTTGFPLFRLQVLTGEPFVFPAEALKIRAKRARKNAGDWQPPPDNNQYQRERLNVLLEYGCQTTCGGGVDDKGTGRNDGALLRADKCRECGYNSREALHLLIEWNKLNTPKSLPLPDLERIVKSAYSGAAFNIGFSNSYAELEAAHNIVKSPKSHADAQHSRIVGTPTEIADAVIGSIVVAHELRRKRALDAIDALLHQSTRSASDATKRVLWQTMLELIYDETVTQKRTQLSPWLAWMSKLTLFICRAKRGKTTFSTSDAVAACEWGHKVAFISLEESMADIKQRAIEMSVDRDRVWKNFIVSKSIPKGFDNLKNAIEMAVYYHKVEIVYIDSLSSYLTEVLGRTGKNKIQTTDAEEAGYSVRRLKLEIADPLNVAVVLLAHSGKGTVIEARGSTGFEDAVDMLVTFEGEPANEERNIRYKGRWTQQDRTVSYQTDLNRFKDIGAASDESVGVSKSKKRTKTDDAYDLLVEMLKDGSCSGSEIIHTAEKANLDRWAIDRAAKRLGVDRSGKLWKLTQSAKPSDYIDNTENTENGE